MHAEQSDHPLFVIIVIFVLIVIFVNFVIIVIFVDFVIIVILVLIVIIAMMARCGRTRTLWCTFSSTRFPSALSLMTMGPSKDNVNDDDDYDEFADDD